MYGSPLNLFVIITEHQRTRTDLSRTTCDGGWSLGMDPRRDLLVRNPPSSGSGVSGVLGVSGVFGKSVGGVDVSGLGCLFCVCGWEREALIEILEPD